MIKAKIMSDLSDIVAMFDINKICFCCADSPLGAAAATLLYDDTEKVAID